MSSMKRKLNLTYIGIRKKHKGRFGKLKRIIGFLRGFVADISDDNLGLYAAQSAFFSVLSAVPFVMLVIMCLRYFVNVDVAEVIAPIIKVLPYEVSDYISMIISEVFYRSENIALLSVTVVTVLWTSSRGTMAIYGGLNNIYGYTKKRNWFITRVLAFFYNILFIVAVVVSVVVLVFGNALISFIDTEFIFAHYILTIVFKLKYLIFFILFVLAFAAVYTFLPQRKLKYRKQFIGSLAAATGWIVFSYGFAVYIKHFSKFSFLYGSITAVVILMLWVYFCQYMFLIGAEINKHIENGCFRKIKLCYFKR